MTLLCLVSVITPENLEAPLHFQDAVMGRKFFFLLSIYVGKTEHILLSAWTIGRCHLKFENLNYKHKVLDNNNILANL